MVAKFDRWLAEYLARRGIKRPDPLEEVKSSDIEVDMMKKALTDTTPFPGHKQSLSSLLRKRFLRI